MGEAEELIIRLTSQARSMAARIGDNREPFLLSVVEIRMIVTALILQDAVRGATSDVKWGEVRRVK